MTTWVLLQLAACFFMTGLVWIIQLIHYPGFGDVDRERFAGFHGRHTRALSLLAGPAMVVELVSALMLATEPGWFWRANLAVVILLWILTFFVSVPLHNRLAAGLDHEAVNRLVRTNWPRTLLWSLKATAIFLFLVSTPH